MPIPEDKTVADVVALIDRWIEDPDPDEEYKRPLRDLRNCILSEGPYAKRGARAIDFFERTGYDERINHTARVDNAGWPIRCKCGQFHKKLSDGSLATFPFPPGA